MTLELHVPIFKTEKIKQSTFIQGPLVWNSLPTSISKIQNLIPFKKQCYDHFLSR